jgi:hypothetical protein
MKRFLLTASVLTLVGLGCSHTLMQPGAATPAEEQQSKSDAAATTKSTGSTEPKQVDVAPPEEGQSSAAAGAMLRRNPGDFVVYRFSGSYRKSPVTVTQRIIDRRDGVLVVDVAIEDEGKRDELRLRVHDVPGEPDDVLSVARVDSGVLKPFGVAAYEALMAKTMLSVDRNEALLNTEEATIKIGTGAFDCVKSSYRIRTGDNLATMTTLESSTFAWGDLGGQIQAADGSLLYKAEVVDYGSAAAKPAGSVAAQAYDPDELSDDYAK